MINKRWYFKISYYFEWTSPVVLVPKSNDTVCFCGDYRCLLQRATVNANAENDNHPLLRKHICNNM